MFDVAFEIEGPWELPEDVPPEFLLLGMLQRLTSLSFNHLTHIEDITEAFGFCDACAVEEPTQSPI